MTFLDDRQVLRRALSLVTTAALIAALLFAAPAAPALAVANPGIQFEVVEATAGEASTTYSVVVELLDMPDANFTADVVVVGGTATGGGTDYTLGTPQVSFTTAQEMGATDTVDVTIVSDGDTEGNETIIFGLDNLTNGAEIGANDALTLVIEDDDGEAFSFRVSETAVAETAGPVSLDVVYTGAANLVAETTVTATFSGGTATDGTDITTFGSQDAVFTASSAPGTIVQVTLTVTVDSDVELPETVILQLAGTGVVAGSDTMTITIEDDDSAVVSVADASSVAESGNVDFTVSLTPAAAYDVDFTYAVSEDSPTASALSGVDFGVATPASPITFTAGQTTKTISVPVLADSLDEGDETFTFTLTGATDGVLGVSVASGTITDDDTADLVVSALTVNPVTEGGSTSFDVSLATQPFGTVTVGVSSTDTSLGFDVTSLDFDSGTWSTPQTVTVTPADDALVEYLGSQSSNVDVAVTSAPSDAPYVGQSDFVAVSVTENDTASVVFDVAGPTSGSEGTSVDVDLRLVTMPPGGSLAAGVVVTPSISVTDDTATTPADYTYTPASLTFPDSSADGATVTATVDLVFDDVTDVDETFDVNLLSVTGPASVTPATHVVEIQDVGDSIVEFDLASSTFDEGTTATVNVVIDVPGGFPVPSNVTVDVSELGGSTAAASDHSFVDPTTIVIPNGTPSGTLFPVSIPLADDSIVENDETLNLTLAVTDGPAAAGTEDAHTVTIVETQEVTIEFAASSSTGAEGTTTPEVGVTLDAGGETLAVPVSALVGISGGTATGSDHGFTTLTSVVFTGTETLETVAINPVTDTLVEGDETLDLLLQSPSVQAVIGAGDSHTFTITDANAVPTIEFSSVDPLVIGESDANGSVVVEISMAPGDELAYEVVVPVSVAGTATSGADFAALGASVTFPVGAVDAATQSIVINPSVDAVHEPTETILLSFGTFTGPAVPGTDVTHTVEITDENPVTVEFAAGSVSGAEGTSPSLAFVVTVPGGGTTVAPIAVTIVDDGTGTAGAPADATLPMVVIPTGTSGTYSDPSTLR